MAGYFGKTLRGSQDDAIAQAIAADRQALWTAMPGRIKSFDPATQRATVEVLYRPRFNSEPTPMPDLVEVPVMSARGGGFAVTFPLKPGDGVEIMFQGRNMDAWYGTGGDEPAGTSRMHDLSDAVAIPGLVADPGRLGSYNADSLEIRNEAGTAKIEMTADGKVAIESAGEELVAILDEFMAVMQTHTNDGLPHDQAGAVAALRGRLASLLRD